jgi:hypothetical protein
MSGFCSNNSPLGVPEQLFSPSVNANYSTMRVQNDDGIGDVCK